MEENKKSKTLITKEMFISEVVSLHPEVVPIFMEYGLHCVGCFVSDVETIEEGSLGHGMSEDDVENMLLDANEAIELGENE